MSGFTRSVGEFVEIIEPFDDDDATNETWSVLDHDAFPTIKETSDASKYLPPVPLDAPRLFGVPFQPRVTDDEIFQAVQQEELEMKDWPRRLLHVPTMTSFEWEPGNVYKAKTEPAYNAITYTWGRWKLDDADLSTQSLPVANVPWKVPKVDPAHFTVAEFLQALKRSTSEIKNPTPSNPNYQAVEFIWLDVACICQDVTDPRSAAEIGRQAQIFHRAQAVFVWLTTLDQVRLNSILNKLYRDVASGWPEEPRLLEPQTALEAFAAMEALLDDPWSSSLWTLQEAFLRNNALLMAKGGHVTQLKRHFRTMHGILAPYHTPVDLVEVLGYADELRELPRDCCPPSSSQATVSLMRELHAKILFLVRSRGLLALNTTSPLSTFIAASDRMTLRPEDRIYAIQQIFRLRLGASDTGRTSAIMPDRIGKYDLVKLQDQLREQLMLRYPIHSQMHVYTQPVPIGKGWRVSEMSVVPGGEKGKGIAWEPQNEPYVEAPFNWPDDTEEYRKLCRLDISFVEDAIWGQFEGRTCPFSIFNTAVGKYEADCIMTPAYEAGSIRNFFHIWLDVTTELQDSPEYKRNGYHPVPATRQRNFALWIARHFAKHDLRVLILGWEAVQDYDGGNMLGLLILRKLLGQVQYWHRIGICRWMASQLKVLGREHHMGPFFEGFDGSWELTRGLLG